MSFTSRFRRWTGYLKARPDTPTRLHSMLPLEARLPVEIERYIFEMTAITHPEMRARLVLVARRVQIWIDPMPYKSIKLSTPSVEKKFLYALKSKPSRFAHVKTLYVMNSISHKHASHILEACGNIENLGCYFEQSAKMPFDDFSLQPRRLYWYIRSNQLELKLLSTLSSQDVSTSFFSNVTHLFIDKPEALWVNWDGLSSLPNLTHLGFNTGPANDIPINETLRTLLDECRTLKVLVVIMGVCHIPVQGFQATGDPRCVYVESRQQEKEIDFFGEPSRWAEAEAAVEMQRIVDSQLRQTPFNRSVPDTVYKNFFGV